MVTQVTCDGEFAPVQRRIAQAINSIFSDQFERDKIPAGTTSNYLRLNNFHLTDPCLLDSNERLVCMKLIDCRARCSRTANFILICLGASIRLFRFSTKSFNMRVKRNHGRKDKLYSWRTLHWI